MKKQNVDWEYKFYRMKIVAGFILVCLILVGFLFIVYEHNSQNKLEDAAIENKVLHELILFSADQTIYCINKVNMSIKDFSDEFLQFKINTYQNRTIDELPGGATRLKLTQ